MLVLVLLLATTAIINAVNVTIIHVNGSYTGSIANGTESFPCPSLKCGLQVAQDGDVIQVAPGVYTGPNNNDLCSKTEICPRAFVLSGIERDHESVVVTTFHENTRAITLFNMENVRIENITFRNFSFSKTIVKSPNETPKEFILDEIMNAGAAIDVVASNVDMLNVRFYDNGAAAGGAMKISNSSNVTMTLVHFERNSAAVAGGAIVLLTSSLLLRESRFVRNIVVGSNNGNVDVDGSGGAIYGLGSEHNTFQFYHSDFTNNTAGEGGGAVYLRSISDSPRIFYGESLIFSGNSLSGYGKCISINSCDSNGGALYLDVASVNISYSNFSLNSVKSSAANTFAQGGALFLTAKASPHRNNVLLYDCIFEFNSASSYGGAIYTLNQNLFGTRLTFLRNVAGQASLMFADNAAAGGALWYSSQTSYSEIRISHFTENTVFGGWGAAIFCTNAAPQLKIVDCQFERNQVYSSYTFVAQGGAVMVSHGSNVVVESTIFLNNSALPRLTVNPLTFSGAGGALFVASAEVALINCDFSFNRALSGQFDDGASGGAILMENVGTASISGSSFYANSAQGYFGYSSYASSGTGGAITLKFSAVEIVGCSFLSNWVSVGGTHMSLGGALAIFFDYTGTHPVVSSPVWIKNSSFHDNVAYSQLCRTFSAKTGQGGALAIIGFGGKGVLMSFVNFTRNVAVATRSGAFPSIGGAVSVSLISNVTGENCEFKDNVALYGFGNDISSYSGENADAKIDNILNMVDSKFVSLVSAKLASEITNNTRSLCFYSKTYKSNAKYRRLFADTKQSATIQDVNEQSIVSEFSLDYNDLQERDVPDLEIELASIEKYYYSDGNSAQRLTQQQQLMRKYVDELKLVIAFLRERDTELTDPIEEDAEDSSFDTTDVEDFEEQRFRRQLRERGKYIKNAFVEAPSVIVTAGKASFKSPDFQGNYHVFVGNFLYLRELYSTASAVLPTKEKLMDLLKDTAMPTTLTIDGKVSQETLIVTIVKAVLHLSRNDNYTMTIKELRMWNGTMFIANNVSITGNSSVVDSAFHGITDSDIAGNAGVGRPSIRFFGHLHTGIGVKTTRQYFNKFVDQHANISTRIDDDYVSKFRNYMKSVPLLTLSSCVLSIETYAQFTGSWVDIDSQGIEIIIRLQNLAYVHVSAGATLEINTGTIFVGDNEQSLVLLNGGHMVLAPLTDLSGSFIDSLNSQFSRPTMTSSTYSSLHAYGRVNQLSTGYMALTVDSDYAHVPILNMSTNASLLGTISISIRNGSKVTTPFYGGNYSSAWTIAMFSTTSPLRSDVDPPVLLTTPGVKMETSYSRLHSNGPVLETVTVTSISCNDLNEYFKEPHNVPEPNAFCATCTLNSSCSFCQYQSGPACVEHHECSGSVWSSCCEGGKDCGAHGYCNVDDSFSCQYYCGVFYEPKEGCHLLSKYGITIIFVVSFVVCFSVAAVLYYRFYRRQKTEILDELRNNLLSPAALNHAGNGGQPKKSAVPHQFIEELQKSLILKDVFVDYNELRFEEKIGEGSFGVVHKAFFRGAQVAVKKMRSPLFAELTQNDIDEFKKEAYMMSRLRHPNIVLVMGISLLDAELPSNRRASSTDGEVNVEGQSASVNQISLQTAAAIASFSRRKTEVKSNKTVCIITEYLEQGSLADILYGPTRLPPEVFTYELILACALQAARGMLYLHSHSPPICHRDLKSSNLVVDDHWVVKVTDFGMSRIVPEKVQDLELGIGPLAEEEREARSKSSTESVDYARTFSNYFASRSVERLKSVSETESQALSQSMIPHDMTSNLGTTAWCAPELLSPSGRARYSVKVDVYSFGMVLWEMWEKRRPFDEFTSRFDIMDAIRSGRRPPISDSCPPAYRSIMQRCWQSEPARRPTFKYIERYLKDELARVKRQRSNSTSIARYSIEQAGSAISSIIDEIPGMSSKRSIDEPVEIPPIRVTSLEEGQPGNAISNPLISTAPDGRAPLVAFDRSFSYLTSSNSPKDSVDVAHSPSSDYHEMEGEGSGKTTAPQPQDSSRPTSGNWRDRYVLKFSGWQQSKPDAGLPPALAQSRTAGSHGTDISQLPPRARKNGGNSNFMDSIVERESVHSFGGAGSDAESSSNEERKSVEVEGIEGPDTITRGNNSYILNNNGGLFDLDSEHHCNIIQSAHSSGSGGRLDTPVNGTGGATVTLPQKKSN